MKKLEGVANVLPRLPSDISTIRLRMRGDEGADDTKVYRVRRKKVEEALRYLKLNNKFYEDIVICNQRLASLPDDGDIVSHEGERTAGSSGETRDEGPADLLTTDISINGMVMDEGGLTIYQEPRRQKKDRKTWWEI